MLSLREVNGNRVTRAYWWHADLSNSLPFQEKGKQSREFTTADDWIEMSWYFSTNSHGTVIHELAASLSPESLLKMQNLGLHSRPFESESEKHCFNKNDNGSHIRIASVAWFSLIGELILLASALCWASDFPSKLLTPSIAQLFPLSGMSICYLFSIHFPSYLLHSNICLRLLSSHTLSPCVLDGIYHDSDSG